MWKWLVLIGAATGAGYLILRNRPAGASWSYSGVPASSTGGFDFLSSLKSATVTLVSDVGDTVSTTIRQAAASISGDLIDAWAHAIQSFEGWTPGSRSYRNNNPGNLRYAGQFKATGADADGFAIFANYSDGFEALKSQLRVYVSRWPDKSLADIMAIYAPSADHNNPTAYANYIASQLGISASATLGSIFG